LRNTYREELEAGEKLCGQQEEDAAFGENGVQPQIAIYIGKIYENMGK
jgi:hypothetical protein